MDLRTIADTIRSIGDARASAANHLETVVQSLAHVYESYNRARLAVTRLDEAKALVGTQATELRELRDDLDRSRAMVAEIVHALSGLCRDQTLYGAQRRMTAAEAHEGMRSKLLAEWEQQALREAVVKGLAGSETPP